MPEEINRLLTDHIADYLFTTSVYDNANLKKEGIPQEKIHLVGNIALDSLSRHLDRAKQSAILDRLGLKHGERITSYALLTLHRVSNVDDQKVFSGIISGLDQVRPCLPILFPAHPRTVRRIEEFGLENHFQILEDTDEPLPMDDCRKIIIVPPQGYLDFTCLLAHSDFVLTDSGGIQTEATFLGIPCLTLRENTEWILTLEKGTNHLVGIDPDRIRRETVKILESERPSPQIPQYWDGRTAVRIKDIIIKNL
jgi:UDP-N-acetylglucosamine 2-epimerase (non-hydrolysing)